jgi:hypothetical protein
VIFEVIAALSDCTFINKRETSYAKSNKLDQFKKKFSRRLLLKSSWIHSRKGKMREKTR